MAFTFVWLATYYVAPLHQWLETSISNFKTYLGLFVYFNMSEFLLIVLKNENPRQILHNDHQRTSPSNVN